MENTETKVCSKCGLEKPLSDYYFRKDYNGYINVCSTCRWKRSKDYNDRNKDKVKENRKNNKHMEMFRSARCRAKRKGMEFSIDINDIVIPEVCPVLGIPILTYIDNRPNDNSPSLDRIDNTKGYVKGNVRVISHRANSIKRNATYNELLLIAEYVKKNSIDIDS